MLWPINFYYDVKRMEKHIFYGAWEGNKIDLLKKDNRVSFCVFTHGFQKQGDWSNYPTSVIIRGRIAVVQDQEQIRKQRRHLDMKYYPYGRKR